jgi:hypothetical protein
MKGHRYIIIRIFFQCGGAYMGRYWPGTYSGIFKARVRRERYIALSTLTSNPTGYGWLLSEVLSLPKMDPNIAANSTQLQLRINAEIATSGFVAVQFEDGSTGNSIPGYTFDECKSLHENGIRQLLEWSRQNGTSSNVTYTVDLTLFVNYSDGIQIRIQMAHTKLYSCYFPMPNREIIDLNYRKAFELIRIISKFIRKHLESIKFNKIQ